MTCSRGCRDCKFCHRLVAQHAEHHQIAPLTATQLTMKDNVQKPMRRTCLAGISAVKQWQQVKLEREQCRMCCCRFLLVICKAHQVLVYTGICETAATKPENVSHPFVVINQAAKVDQVHHGLKTKEGLLGQLVCWGQ